VQGEDEEQAALVRADGAREHRALAGHAVTALARARARRTFYASRAARVSDRLEQSVSRCRYPVRNTSW
jgi:hypothetical protein